MTKFHEIEAIIASSQQDAKKAADGNKAAGTRLRKAYKQIFDLAKQGRKEVLEAQKSE
jgi:hypothetical protein